MNAGWLKFLPKALSDYLDGRHQLQAILGNSGWLFTDKLLRMGIGVFVSVWVARYLGPEQFGQWNYVIAYVSIFGALASFGLDGIVVRDLVKHPDSKAKILGTALVLRFISSFIVMALALVYFIFLRKSDFLTLCLVALSAAGYIFQSASVVDMYFQSKTVSKYTVIASNGAFFITAILKVALLINHAGLLAFAVAGLIELALTSIFLMLAYRCQGESFLLWEFDAAIALTMIKSVWPVVLSGLAVAVQARIDQVMLGDMVGNNEVGQYSAAMRLIEMLGIVPVILVQSVAPAITRAKLAGDGLYERHMISIYRLMFVIFLIVAMPVFLVGDQMIAMIYGSHFKEAGTLLSLFAIRQLFVNFGVAKDVLFITNEGLFKYAFVAGSLGALVNIGANYLLIPSYHSIGALWATIISFSFSIFIIDVISPKTRQNFAWMMRSIVTFYKFSWKA